MVSAYGKVDGGNADGGDRIVKLSTPLTTLNKHSTACPELKRKQEDIRMPDINPEISALLDAMEARAQAREARLIAQVREEVRIKRESAREAKEARVIAQPLPHFGEGDATTLVIVGPYTGHKGRRGQLEFEVGTFKMDVLDWILDNVQLVKSERAKMAKALLAPATKTERENDAAEKAAKVA